MHRGRVAMLVRNPFTHESRGEREARTLAEAGYEVIIIADEGAGLPERERRDFAEVRRVRLASRAIPFARFAIQQVRYAAALLRTRADLFHCHDSDALLAVSMAALVGRTPFVYDGHELWLGRQQPGRGWLYRTAYRLFYGTLERLALPRAAGVIVANPPVGPHLEREYGLRGVVAVPNYPDRSELPAEGTGRDIRDLPGGDRIPAEAPLAVYLGHLMAGRGLEPTIRALPDVPGMHLALLGGGDHRAVLARVVDELGLADRVHFFEPVPPDQVVAYAASADVGLSVIEDTCLNYRYALPNKLFQYMAAGIPIVASDFPQVREVVADSGAGLVVDPASPAEIAAALRVISTDPARAAQMAEAARRAAREAYRWEVSAQRLLDVYARASERARLKEAA